MKSLFYRLSLSVLTLIVVIVPISKAQLPINLLPNSTDANTFVGIDVLTLGLPIAMVITTTIENNSFRFGASSGFSDSQGFDFSQLDVGDITVSLEYDRLFENPFGYVELGTALLVGSSFQSINRFIETPALAFNIGFRNIIANKLMFRINVAPIISPNISTFSAGIGLSYRVGSN